MSDTSRIIGSALVLTAGLAAASCADAPPGDPLALDPIFDAEAVAYAGGRPLVLSPDGRHVAFSILPADGSPGESTAATGARELAAVRILDLVTERVRAPAVGATARRHLDEGHDPVPTLRCWDPEGRVLYMRTTARSWLALDVGRQELAWGAASDDRTPPDCPAREVPRAPYRAGDFEVTATRGGGLRVEHIPRGRVVFESAAPRASGVRHLPAQYTGGA